MGSATLGALAKYGEAVWAQVTIVYVEATPAQLPNLLNVLEDMADRGEVVGYGEESDVLARDQRSEGEGREDG